MELDTTIDSLTNNINNLELNKSSLELKDEKTYFVEENNQHGSLAAFKISELRTTIDNINTYKNRIGDIETNIVKIITKINNAIVKTTKAGVVNTNIEMVDTLASGAEVLTIIPENDSEYKVNIYVSNDNVGKLREGMEGKFNVYALPNSEYGYLKGALTSGINFLLYKSLVVLFVFAFVFVCLVVNTYFYYYNKSKGKRKYK